MSAWKSRLVVLTVIFLGVSFLIFFVTGYTALYWAWGRANSETARAYLPWARNFGMLAMAGAAAIGTDVLFETWSYLIVPVSAASARGRLRRIPERSVASTH